MRSLLVLCFTLSGMSSLIYEITWLRQLESIFGSTAIALTLCLAVYIAGLAIGADRLGRIAESMEHPVHNYGRMEFGIAALGVISLILLPAIGPINAAL